MAGRKRVYARPSMNTRAKRMKRTFKRKYRRVGRKQSQISSNSFSGGGIGFKKRRFSRKRYNNLLWTSSIAQTHYRSNWSASSVLSTPGVTSETMGVSLQTSRRFAGAAFFVTAGGAINPDGGAMPVFQSNSDITVRGGMYGIRLTNTPDALDVDKDPINVTVYLVRTSKGFSTTNVPSTVRVGWDPTLVQDFQTNIGKVLMKKNYLIRDGDVYTIERRMPVQKIDQTEYAATISEYIWLVTLGTTSSNVARTIVATTYYNMSFVGDTT